MRSNQVLSQPIIILLLLGGIVAILFPGIIMVTFYIIVISVADFIGSKPDTAFLLGLSYMVATTLLFAVIQFPVLLKHKEPTLKSPFFRFYMPSFLLICFWIFLLLGDIQLLAGTEFSSAGELFSSNRSYLDLVIRTSTCYLIPAVIFSSVSVKK